MGRGEGGGERGERGGERGERGEREGLQVRWDERERVDEQPPRQSSIHWSGQKLTSNSNAVPAFPKTVVQGPVGQRALESE